MSMGVEAHSPRRILLADRVSRARLGRTLTSGRGALRASAR